MNPSDFESAHIVVRMKNGKEYVIDLVNTETHPLTGFLTFETEAVERDPAEHGLAYRVFDPGARMASLRLNGVLAPAICSCPLIDTSPSAMDPAFVRGHPAGCPVHGRQYDAKRRAAERVARSAGVVMPEMPDGTDQPPA